MPLSKKETRIPIRQTGDHRARNDDESWQVEAPSDSVSESLDVSADAPTQVGANTMTHPDVDWREMALRLKAEMENYRKRQKRWAEDEVQRETADLLRKFLNVVDNLEQALQHIDPHDPTHQGVQLAYDDLLHLLLRQGVERIFAKGAVFDPNRHEAVAMVPAPYDRGADEMRVVEVTSPGYMYNERVLRPAKVVVAKPVV